MTMLDRCNELEAIGIIQTYVFAVPQGWANEVRAKTGVYPPGHVVWCYDEFRMGGRPFAIDMLGWMCLKWAELAGVYTQVARVTRDKSVKGEHEPLALFLV